MKKLSIIFLLGAIILFSSQAEAQGLLKKISRKAKDKLEQKIEKKAEKKIEEKADEKIDKELDKALGEDESPEEAKKAREKKNITRLQGIMNQMGVESTPVSIEDEYSFSSNIKMNIISLDEQGNELSNGFFNTFFNTSNEIFAYEILNDKNTDEKGFFIYDTENNASIILTEDKGEKKGIATGLNFNFSNGENTFDENMDELSDSNTSLNPNIKKTTNTKKILGYKCTEYILKDENTQSSLWLTKEKAWKTKNLFTAIFESSQYASGFPVGFIMESISTNLETNERSHMIVTEINENINKTIDLSLYEIMNMGSFNLNDQ